MTSRFLIFAISFLSVQCVLAFTVPKSHRAGTSLSMAPRFDKATEKWVATKPEEEMGSSYGPIGSLIRAGPKPFFQHLFFPDVYDQAVLKYMARDGCDRKEAQGNMDFFIENPNDWTYYKLQEKEGKLKYDFANANTSPKQLALSGAWSIVVIWFFYTFISDCLAGKYTAP